MKKISIIVFIFGSAMFFGNQVKAQHFYTSFGVGVSWNTPAYVNYAIHDHYFGYDIAHVRQFTRHGYTNYNVLLHRNGWFVEVRIDNHGHIYKTINHQWSYPLISHNCGGHCAFHQTYYRTHYPKYHHTTKIVYVDSHHGHGKQNYYSNMHVKKQQKPQPQVRNNTTIRKPAQASKNVANRNLVVRNSSARSSSNNVVVYKNQRGESR